MDITADMILLKIKEISARHLVENPQLGIDSLVLALNIDQNLLVSLLMQLRTEQKVILHHNDKVSGGRSTGRIDDYLKVSLC